MLCHNCNHEVSTEMKFCPNCGAALSFESNEQQNGNPQYQQYNYGQQYGYNQYGQNNYGNQYGGQQYGYNPQYGDVENPEDVPSAGFNVLSFFFPLIGLILYLVWNDKKPKRAKAVGKSAIIGFIVGIVLNIIFYITSTLVSFSLFSYMY